MNKEKLLKILHRFRMVGLIEGISFLVLLFIAMPLKYMFNWPIAVKLVGWAHGALFVAYIYLSFEVFTAFKKDFIWLLKAFAAAIIPFGTFLFDREHKMEEEILLRKKSF